ncbi:hypothetical protein Agub_g9025 [Astrephomene gubernaculifera]|uniref:Uncharacterized protein n=1 Tax=Astrephomene gubernaculifera TaxID=47775 RepID=A0AAD3DVE1_9CHLO|nr:hypothetical protein Agub_g9025 [Astrephomene gubernaculifera]
MQASPSGGMLAVRLASHAMAACSFAASLRPGLAELSLWRTASTSASPDAAESGSSAVPTLTAEQRQQLPRLLSLLDRPGTSAHRLGALTSLAASYRDLSVSLSALHMRHISLNPLTASEADYTATQEVRARLSARTPAPSPDSSSSSPSTDPSSPAPSSASPRRGTFLPLRDVSLLPEDVQVDGVTPAPAQPALHPEHMDKVSCWAALQPPHLEMSHQLQTGVSLFPPSEAAHPTYVDMDAALRLLAHHRSGKRLRLQRRLLRRQDKYQMKTWEHHAGEA